MLCRFFLHRWNESVFSATGRLFFRDFRGGDPEEAEDVVMFVRASAGHGAGGMEMSSGIRFVGQQRNFSHGKLPLGFQEGNLGSFDHARKRNGKGEARDAKNRLGAVDREGATSRFDDDFGVVPIGHEQGAVGGEQIANGAQDVQFVVTFKITRIEVNPATVKYIPGRRSECAVSGMAQEQLLNGGARRVSHAGLNAAAGEENQREKKESSAGMVEWFRRETRVCPYIKPVRRFHLPADSKRCPPDVKISVSCAKQGHAPSAREPWVSAWTAARRPDRRPASARRFGGPTGNDAKENCEP